MKTIIGYQIISNDGKKELPTCFLEIEVIEDIDVAEKWLIYEKANPEFGQFRWVLSPVFEGDIDDPEIIIEI